MKYLGKPFKQDQDGIFSIDNNDAKIMQINFDEENSNYGKFYQIDGVDDYIIKNMSKLPYFLDKIEIRKFLIKIRNKQPLFDDIDFPLGYYLDNGKIRGTIISYYKNSPSIMKIINNFHLSDLKKYYQHDDDEYYNLICLLLDVLHLIEEMYQENIVYTDINTGNFLVHNNSVKVVDFEPCYVHFTKNKDRYYQNILTNYGVFVSYLCHCYKLRNVYYNPGETFEDAKAKVKSLRRDMMR